MNTQLPKVKLDDFMKFVKSKELIVAGAAILVTPFLLGGVEKIRSKFPFLKDHFTIGMLIAGFVVFIIAGVITKEGTARLILVGIAAGLAITGIAQPAQDLLTKTGEALS